jgi:hypothetical protein
MFTKYTIDNKIKLIYNVLYHSDLNPIEYIFIIKKRIVKWWYIIIRKYRINNRKFKKNLNKNITENIFKNV